MYIQGTEQQELMIIAALQSGHSYLLKNIFITFGGKLSSLYQNLNSDPQTYKILGKIYKDTCNKDITGVFFKLLLIFREETGGRETKRNIDVWLPVTCPLLGTWPATQACALDRQLNQ